MFHLFGRVYIALDAAIDLDYHRFVISKDFGYPLDSTLENLHPNKLIGYGKTFEDLVGSDKRYKTYAELLQECIKINNSDQKFIMYCDKESFLKFMCMWFKSIFLQIDSEFSFKIIRAYFLKILLLSEFTTRGVKGVAIHYQKNMPDYEEYKSIFNSTAENIPLTYIVGTIGNQKSIEYLLASYLYNGSYKEEIKSRIKIMISRHIEENIKEAWRNIIQNSLKIPMQQAIGLNYTLENLEDIVLDNNIKLLTDLNSWRTLYSRFDRKPDLDLTIFSDEEILQLKNLMTLSVVVKNNSEMNNPIWKRAYLYIDILRTQELSDQDLEKIINLEISSASEMYDDWQLSIDNFWGIKDSENINTFLIDYIIHEKILNNNYSIGKFVLK